MLNNAATTTGKKQRHSKTLTSLLKYFEGIQITVELKTGKMFFGTLSSGDETMSLTLTNVETVTKPITSSINNNNNDEKQEASIAATASSFDDSPAARQQEQQEQSLPPPLLSIVQIRGSTIRYIHFPDNADISMILKHGIDRERAAAARYQRGVRKTASGK